MSACSFLLTACSEEDKVIARVGETELTESDAYVLMKHRGYDSKDKEQYRELINEWCENEIFNQELKATNATTVASPVADVYIYIYAYILYMCREKGRYIDI